MSVTVCSAATTAPTRSRLQNWRKLMTKAMPPERTHIVSILKLEQYIGNNLNFAVRQCSRGIMHRAVAMKPGLSARVHQRFWHAKPKEDNASMRPDPFVAMRIKICLLYYLGLRAVDNSVLTAYSHAKSDVMETSAMIQAHISDLSALRIEGMSLTTMPVECDVQGDAPAFGSIPSASRKWRCGSGHDSTEPTDKDAERENEK